MTDSTEPAPSGLTHGVTGFKKRGRVPPGVIGRRRILIDRRALQAALEDTRLERTPQVDLLIRQIVRTETILTLGFNWLDRGGVLKETALAHGELTFQPVLRELISAMNTQRLAILALGLNRKTLEEKWALPWEDVSAHTSLDEEAAETQPKSTSRDIPGRGEGGEEQKNE